LKPGIFYSKRMMILVDAHLAAIVVLGDLLQEWGNDPCYILWSKSRLTKSMVYVNHIIYFALDRGCGYFSSLCGVLDEFVEASRINCSNHLEPLAFISHGPKEQIVLKDICKGKIAGGKAVCKSSFGRVYNRGQRI
jgi:hypothetical protein